MYYFFVKLCVEVDYVKKEFSFRRVKVYIIKRGGFGAYSIENQCTMCFEAQKV